MGTLTVSKTNDYLLRDGRPWLYLADTAWSAFTNPTREEWTYYLDFRRRQGFTALQINTMPQPDRSDNSWDAPLPFARDQDGSYRWDKPQAEYYQRAGELAMMAAQCGFVPALVLLWASMIHGTGSPPDARGATRARRSADGDQAGWAAPVGAPGKGSSPVPSGRIRRSRPPEP